MGFFDRFSAKRPAARPAPAANPTPAQPTPPTAPAAPAPAPASVEGGGGVKARLIEARERLEAHDLPGALAIYDEVVAAAGDRPDVLVTISGDLGENGHVREIIELIAPRYDAERHGPATGVNLVQAYLVAKDADAAQHVLDILFSLKRPELQERLYGFSNAIAELMQGRGGGPEPTNGEAPRAPAEATHVNLVSISKPIWFYGLEPLAEQVLPPKAERLRRVAFAQLAVLGVPDFVEAAKRPEDELGRFSRGLPLWLAETFYFSPHYSPIAAVGLQGAHYALFAAEWTAEHLRQLVETNKEPIDYVFTGALRQKEGDYELILRVWEVKKFRERKQFIARWAPATADAELAKLHEQVRLFMEWTPEQRGLAYAPPASPRTWIDVLGGSLSLFLCEKGLLPKEQVPGIDDALARAAMGAAASEAASLAFLTLRNRAEKLALAGRLEGALAASPLIAQARDVVQ